MFIGIAICVMGFFALSLVNSLPMLYAALILGIVLGSSLGYHMPISLLIAKIFRERRSLAFGIFRMGPGNFRPARAACGLADQRVGLENGAAALRAWFC